MRKILGNGVVYVEEEYYPETSGEDPTCGVICDCDMQSNLWVSDYEIVKCPACGKGYKTEFVVWQYDKDENDNKEEE